MVTPRIERYVRLRFDDDEAELVLSVLRDWRISYLDEPPHERFIAAAVLMADGQLDGLDDALRLAEEDWRDLLVAADLADEDWRTVMSSHLG